MKCVGLESGIAISASGQRQVGFSASVADPWSLHPAKSVVVPGAIGRTQPSATATILVPLDLHAKEMMGGVAAASHALNEFEGFAGGSSKDRSRLDNKLNRINHLNGDRPLPLEFFFSRIFNQMDQSIASAVNAAPRSGRPGTTCSPRNSQVAFPPDAATVWNTSRSEQRIKRMRMPRYVRWPAARILLRLRFPGLR